MMRGQCLWSTWWLCLLLLSVCQHDAHGQNLLNSYLPASMQALAYYIDQLQYEPLSTSTVEPPFRTDDNFDAVVATSTTTTNRPPSANDENSPDWRPPTWWGALTSSTQKPTTAASSSTSTTRRTTPWWRPSTTSTTTKMPVITAKPTSWWSYSSAATKQPTMANSSTTPKPTSWWSSSTTTTSKPISWWRPSSTTTSTTRKPTSWWSYTTSTPVERQPTIAPTLPHRPGIYAPAKSPNAKQRPQKLEGYEVFNEIGDNPEGIDQLTLGLIRDILAETNHDEFTNDFDSLDNFLRLYDDNYGRAAFDPDAAMDRWSSTSMAGKKRVPPTKPYVEFLLAYDLLKRDAKAANLSKYEGFAPEMMQELTELSKASAERQLYTMFKRMLDRGDIQRSDVVSRIQSIMKDLGNPDSITAKSLRFIPALPFEL